MANNPTQGGAFDPYADYNVHGTWTFTGDTNLNYSSTTLVDATLSGTTTIGAGATLTAPTLTTPSLGVATATSINGNVLTTGSSTYTGTAGQTYTFPTTSATIARIDAANTFTGVQTMTSAALTTPVLTGSVTGTYTLAGTPTLTAPTINTATLNGAINTDFKVLAASATYSATTTPATLTGFSWTVVPGTYVFKVNLPATMTTVGGLTIDFLLTTAVLTSIRYQSYATTATDNADAVSTQGTTTTSGTKVFDSKTAAYTLVEIAGSMVVGTGGTFAWQGTQNTSAGAGDATIVLLGAYAQLTRVA